MNTGLMWSKSTYSDDQGGACVEVAHCPEVVRVRDSKDADGPQLAFAPETWSAFVTFAPET